MSQVLDLPRDACDQLAAWETTAPPIGTTALALFQELAAASLSGASSSEDVQLELIRAAFESGYYRIAIAALREMASTERRSSPCHLVLSTFLLRRGDPEAGSVLQRCLMDFPGPHPAWVELGDVLLDKNKPEAALLCFAKGPPNADLALRCGLVARDLGRIAEAVSWFAEAVRFAPASERGWFLLGTCSQDRRDFARAVSAFRTVLNLNPGRVEAEVNLGMCLQEMSLLDEAKQSYARAVRARPDTFGRIAQALPGSPKGELWLDLRALRRNLVG